MKFYIISKILLLLNLSLYFAFIFYKKYISICVGVGEGGITLCDDFNQLNVTPLIIISILILITIGFWYRTNKKRNNNFQISKNTKIKDFIIFILTISLTVFTIAGYYNLYF